MIRYATIGLIVSTQAWAGIAVVPIRNEKHASADQVITSRSTPKVTTTQARNFGKTVSTETKVFQKKDNPRYRNFGEWVSSQRRHKKTRGPDGTTPPSDCPRRHDPPTVVKTPPKEVPRGNPKPSTPSTPSTPSIPTAPTGGFGT